MLHHSPYFSELKLKFNHFSEGPGVCLFLLLFLCLVGMLCRQGISATIFVVM